MDLRRRCRRIQFYNVTLDMSTPVWAYGSIQDYGSRRGAIDLTRGRDRIPAVAWSDAPGGEGSHHAIERSNNDIVYPTASTGTSRGKMWPPLRPSAPKPRQEARPRDGAVAARGDEHPAARGNSAGWAVR